MGRRLTDIETLLFNLDQTPQFGTNIGAILLLDKASDPQHLRNAFASCVAKTPAFREFVHQPAAPLSPLVWMVDQHFDLDHHVRFLRLPKPATRAGLLATASAFVNDPFDRTRPLWQAALITGSAKVGAALAVKLHHSIADGQAAVALGSVLLESQASAEPAEAVDLARVLGDLASDETTVPASLADTIRSGATRLAGFLNEATERISQAADSEPTPEPGAAFNSITDGLSSISGPGSPLWKQRSRNRRYLAYSLPLAALKKRARALDASVNDLFVVACAEAALIQHERQNVSVQWLTTTVIVSTRAGEDPASGNAFVPVAIRIPGSEATTQDRLAAVTNQVKEKRALLLEATDVFGAIGTVAALLPSSMAAALALDQTSRVDFATSSLVGPPGPVWIAGQPVRSILPLGPVAGTAFNATLLSHEGQASIGLHIDPVAIQEPATLRADLRRGLKLLGLKSLPK